MGNSETTNINKLDTVNYHEITITKNNPFTGKISVWQNNQTQQKVALLTTYFQDEESYIQCELTNKKHLQLINDYIVRLINITGDQQSNLCSSVYQIQVLYEYVDYSIADDIQERRLQKIPYQESELWLILYSVLSALSYLQQKQLQFGDIKPTTILIDGDGKVKILPKNIFSNQPSSYVQYIQERKLENLYLSPQLMENLKTSNLVPLCSLHMSDIFTLAIVVLECALLQPLINLNDFLNFKVSKEIIGSGLEFVQQNYSQNLLDFLILMLKFDEQKRLDADSLIQNCEKLSKSATIQVSHKLFSCNFREKSKIFQASDLQVPQDFNIDNKFNELRSDQNFEQSIVVGQTWKEQQQQQQGSSTEQTTQQIQEQSKLIKEGDIIDGRYQVIHTEFKKKIQQGGYQVPQSPNQRQVIKKGDFIDERFQIVRSDQQTRFASQTQPYQQGAQRLQTQPVSMQFYPQPSYIQSYPQNYAVQPHFLQNQSYNNFMRRFPGSYDQVQSQFYGYQPLNEYPPVQQFNQLNQLQQINVVNPDQLKVNAIKQEQNQKINPSE